MAKREIFVDDLDGQEHTDDNPVLTWQFSYGPGNKPESYTIDLSEPNYNKLVEALEPFVKVATRIEQPSRGLVARPAKPSAGADPKKDEKRALREDYSAWLKETHNVDYDPGKRVVQKYLGEYYAARKISEADQLYPAP